MQVVCAGSAVYLGYIRHAMQGAGTCAVTAELHPKPAGLLLSSYKSLCLSKTYRRQRMELTCVKLGFLAQDLQMSGSPVCAAHR